MYNKNLQKGGTLDAIATQEIIKRTIEIEEEIKREYEEIENAKPPLVPYYTTIDRSTLSGKIEYFIYKYLDPHFSVRYANKR